MYKDVLQHMDNVAVWPTVSFVIFFLFFILLIWWAVTIDRSFLDTMSTKPFEDGVRKEKKPDHSIES